MADKRVTSLRLCVRGVAMLPTKMYKIVAAQTAPPGTAHERARRRCGVVVLPNTTTDHDGTATATHLSLGVSSMWCAGEMSMAHTGPPVFSSISIAVSSKDTAGNHGLARPSLVTVACTSLHAESVTADMNTRGSMAWSSPGAATHSQE